MWMYVMISFLSSEEYVWWVTLFLHKVGFFVCVCVQDAQEKYCQRVTREVDQRIISIWVWQKLINYK